MERVRILRRLDRYVITEALGPLALGFTIYTFIMLVRFLFRSADMIIRRGLAPSEVGRLVLYTLPNILVLTIPMALLFAILIAIGRLASDSELVAMRATGISLFTLYRPILLLSVILAGLNVYVSAYLLPRANHALQVQTIDILAQTAARQVEPRVFYEEWEGIVLYVFDMDPGGDTWNGVFLAPSVPSAQNSITVAKRGKLQVDKAGENIVLHLEDALTHKVDLDRPQNYELIRHETLDVVLDDQFTTSARAKMAASKGVRELTLTELRRWTRDPSMDVELRRLAAVEIHKKFSIPAACLVFGLFAVPMGFNNRRGGKSSGFAMSIAVIMCFYVLLSNGEDAARVGRIPPWLAMWFPNMLFSALGALLLIRKNQDRSIFGRKLGWWMRLAVSGRMLEVRRRQQKRRRIRREARRRAIRQRTPDVVLRIPRFALRFPNLLDRYVGRLFARVFLLVTLSGVMLYLIADFTDNVDDIFKHHPRVGVVLEYYSYLSLQIIFDIAPILVLVTTLVTFALLSRTNEITSAKALGISLYRLALPAIASAALVAATCILLQAEVLPASNQRVAQLHDRMKGLTTARTYRRVDRQWLFGRGPYIFNYLFFDTARHQLNDLQVFGFDKEHQLAQRLFANQARWDGSRWVLERGWARSFSGPMELGFTTVNEPALSPYREPPDYFVAEVKRPEQMHYTELSRNIAELEQSGQAVPQLKVQLYDKVARPTLSLIMALVALPFAFRLGRRGALYGIGLSLVLGMVLLGVFAFFSTLGQIGALPPIVAVWAPSLIFAALSMYLFLGVRT
jgi:LPS export ABC transporter permease LptF/LPS export ABC transporter permease LptG